MARVVVPEASGLVVDGEVVSWDWLHERGVAVIAGQQYAVVGGRSGASVVMEDREVWRFQRTANMALVVFRCPLCVGRLDDRKQRYCSACRALLEG